MRVRVRLRVYLCAAIEAVRLIQMARAWGTSISLAFYGPLVIAVATAVVCGVMIRWQA